MKDFKIDAFCYNEFAKYLHVNNVFEAIRIHTIFIDRAKAFICPAHRDQKNSKDKHLCTIMWWLAVIMHGGFLKRIGMVC